MIVLTYAFRFRCQARGLAFLRFSPFSGPALGTQIRMAGIAVFAKKAPVSQEAWLCELTGERVRFRAAWGRDPHDFPLALLGGGQAAVAGLVLNARCFGYTRRQKRGTTRTSIG